MSSDYEVLFEGEHLSFRRRRDWEYVEHRKAREAVMVVAVTDREEIVLTEEFRPAVEEWVICLPAGLVGDVRTEGPIEAAARELREETGYEASLLEFLGRGPGSPGASSEIVTFYLARSVQLVGEQSPEDRKIVRVRVVPLGNLQVWAGEQVRQGHLVDPKVWAGLYLAAAAGLAVARPGG